MKMLIAYPTQKTHQARKVAQHNSWIQIGLATVVILALTGLVHSTDVIVSLQAGDWSQNSDGVLILVLVSFFLMFLCALTPLPAETVTLANGLMFGPLAGTLITWTSAMLGAYVTFMYSRRFLVDPNFLEKVQFSHARKWIERWGLVGFLFARLIPLVPFFTLNIGAPLLKISQKNFLLITGIAILPHIVIICCLGDYISHH